MGIKILTIGIIILLARVSISSKKLISSLQLLQLEEYSVSNYLRWLRDNIGLLIEIGPIIKDDKTPIVYTDRMNRLYTRAKQLVVILYILLIPLLFITRNITISLVAILLGILIYYMNPYIVALSAVIQNPVEKKINRGYYEEANKKIIDYKKNGLKVVGITGSYGKTSTKFITSRILKEKFDVQDTPSSYNTPMGLSLVINNELTQEKEIFIAEMGAYVRGEIKEVADLVLPDIGIITSIGPMHLESFKTIDNIVLTKSELLESLPKDGTAIINYDDPNLKKVVSTLDKQTIKYGLENVDELDVYAKNIHTTRSGSEFDLYIRDSNDIQSASCKTKMLGKHNISNILAGAATGYVMGMSINEIKEGISKTEPVEHRLFLISGAGGTTIIDDAFNSNPAGAKAALDVLKDFEGGRKIIVTPGMIGLGDIQEEANKEFGRQIANVCDLVYLVGKNLTQPIYEGLLDENYSKDKIVVVNSLEEATASFGPILKPGDVVLFENDLPDNYSEV